MYCLHITTIYNSINSIMHQMLRLLQANLLLEFMRMYLGRAAEEVRKQKNGDSNERISRSSPLQFFFPPKLYLLLYKS